MNVYTNLSMYIYIGRTRPFKTVMRPELTQKHMQRQMNRRVFMNIVIFSNIFICVLIFFSYLMNKRDLPGM